MESSGISRKNFLKNSALGLAGLAFTPAMLRAQPDKHQKNKTGQASNTYILKNVRLETGFVYEGNEVVATKTDLFSVEIEKGKIKKVSPNQPGAKAIDAKGMLML